MRMKFPLAFLSLAALALGASAAIGTSPPDLLKSSTRDAALKPGLVYQASLFAPRVRITAPERGWRGSQFVSRSYDWLQQGWTSVDGTSGGSIRVVGAPASTRSAATTLHPLETERADSPLVGIDVEGTVAVTIAGFRGQQFEGTATGQYGHTFVPFSGHSRAAGKYAGDHVKYEHGKAFRIVVLEVRGKPVVFFLDSDAPTIDLNFTAAAAKLFALLRFPEA
jgi:hypothetical protein